MVIEKEEIVKYFVIEGEEFKVSDVWDLMEGLYDSSYVKPLLIFDGKLAKILEKLEVITRTTRGSYYRGPKYEEWTKEHGLEV
jgi:hypothetical protein